MHLSGWLREMAKKNELPACVCEFIHTYSLCNFSCIARDYMQKDERGRALPLVQLGAVQLVQWEMLRFESPMIRLSWNRKGERHKNIEKGRGERERSLNRWNMFQRTDWWWYNIFQSGDTQCKACCKVTYLHFCCSLFSCRNPFTPFNSETYKYFSKNTKSTYEHCISVWLPVLWTTYCQRMNHDHVFLPN